MPTGERLADVGPEDHLRKDRAFRPDADPIARGRFWAGAAVVALLAAWWLIDWTWGHGHARHAPGPVHSAHATWENDCAACHLPFRPASGGHGFSALFFSQNKASDQACQKCHMSQASEQHHASQIAGEAAPCATCHRDHRGRDVSLSRMDDSHCTRCHANLDAHTTTGKAAFHPTITAFPRDHPEFSLGEKGKRVPLAQAKDPGNLRFNHRLHLMAGLNLDVKLKHLPKKDGLGQRYWKMQEAEAGTALKDDTKVQLTCASCHALDAGDDPGRKGPDRAAGDYFLPPTYAQHCRACHPLTFSSDAGLNGVEIHHRLQPAQVRDFLAAAFARVLVKDRPTKKAPDEVPLPGDNLTAAERHLRARIKTDADKASAFVFERQAEQAARYVFPSRSTCGLCHAYQGSPKAPTAVLPVNLPEVWYAHAKFSHRAHRAHECIDCHRRATAAPPGEDEPGGSDRAADVLLSGVKKCAECHAPARTVNGVKQGGAGHACVDCHRYHNGDHPLQGRGAARRR